MKKYNLGIGILIMGMIMVIGNFPSELSFKALRSIASGLIVTFIGIIYMTKHKKTRDNKL